MTLKRPSQPLSLVAGLFVLVLLSAVGAVPVGAASTQVDESYPLAAGASVKLTTVTGSVTLVGWDRQEVRVVGSLGAQVEELRVENRDTALEIEVVVAESWNQSGADASADLELHVPRGSRFNGTSVEAWFDAKNAGKALELMTVSGSITVSGEYDELRTQTVSGDQTLGGRGGRCSFQTVSGEIGAQLDCDVLEANSVGGTITYSGGIRERADLSTLSGDLVFDLDPNSGSTLDASTHSGDVDLTLPSDVSARITFQSRSGDLNNYLGGDEAGDEKNRRVTLGSGSVAIGTATFSGDVILRKK